MRHRDHFRRFNRTSEHRLALRRNMSQNMIEHGQITTTLPKAKDVRKYLERLITLAIQVRHRQAAGDDSGALRARRIIHHMLSDRAIIPKDHRGAYNLLSDAARLNTLRMASGRRYRTGDPKGKLEFTADSVMRMLIERVAPRFEGRPGGYTRVVRLPDTRIGDRAQLAVLQFVGGEEAPRSLTKPAPSARKRRADSRYAFAAKVLKQAASA